MDDALIKKYSDELLAMQKKAVPAVGRKYDDSKGGFEVNVTTLLYLYPLEKALVTVFTGPYDDMTVVDTGYTDESGKTERFILDTPAKSSSQSSYASGNAYSSYNLLVQADGYADSVSMDVRVFPGVTSVQKVDMVPLSATGDNEEPRMTESSSDYEL